MVLGLGIEVRDLKPSIVICIQKKAIKTTKLIKHTAIIPELKFMFIQVQNLSLLFFRLCHCSSGSAI